MLKPLWKLEGVTRLSKEIISSEKTERHYVDEHGNKAIIIIRTSTGKIMRRNKNLF